MPTDDLKSDITPSSTEPADDSALLARRRLLKLGAYVPPAIVGMAIIGSVSGTAYASGGHGGHGTVGSCIPSACRPCMDDDDDKKDDDGKKDGDGHHRRRRHHRRCEIEREKKKRRDKKKRKKDE